MFEEGTIPVPGYTGSTAFGLCVVRQIDMGYSVTLISQDEVGGCGCIEIDVNKNDGRFNVSKRLKLNEAELVRLLTSLQE